MNRIEGLHLKILSSVIFISPNRGVMTIESRIFYGMSWHVNYMEYFRSTMQQLSSIGLLS